MKRRLLVDEATVPTESLLRKESGAAFEYYRAIIAVSGDYRKQWQYSHGNGWILKVDDMRKALCYLIAFDEGVEVSLTVRDAERAAFLADRKWERLHPALEAGSKYPEGFALRFEVLSAADCQSVREFLVELMKMRPAPAMLTSKQRATNGRHSESKR